MQAQRLRPHFVRRVAHDERLAPDFRAGLAQARPRRGPPRREQASGRSRPAPGSPRATARRVRRRANRSPPPAPQATPRPTWRAPSVPAASAGSSRESARVTAALWAPGSVNALRMIGASAGLLRASIQQAEELMAVEPERVLGQGGRSRRRQDERLHRARRFGPLHVAERVQGDRLVGGRRRRAVERRDEIRNRGLRPNLPDELAHLAGGSRRGLRLESRVERILAAARGDAERLEIPAILAVVLRNQRAPSRRATRATAAPARGRRRPAASSIGSCSINAISRRTCGDGSCRNGLENVSMFAPLERATRSPSTRKFGSVLFSAS